jgi:hypothetical protein
VRRIALDVVVLFAGLSLVVGYVALAQPGIRDVTLHLYVLAVGALTMLGLITAASDALPRRRRDEFDRALAERVAPRRRLPELQRLEREVTLATSSSYDLHYRLLPHLREIAQARLERQGKRLAPEHVGPWWDLLRPDREAPDDRFSPGISERDLRALVDDLERM